MKNDLRLPIGSDHHLFRDSEGLLILIAQKVAVGMAGENFVKMVGGPADGQDARLLPYQGRRHAHHESAVFFAQVQRKRTIRQRLGETISIMQELAPCQRPVTPPHDRVFVPMTPEKGKQ
jgi:hypothetical protein